jgi:hypothetical protein
MLHVNKTLVFASIAALAMWFVWPDDDVSGQPEHKLVASRLKSAPQRQAHADIKQYPLSQTSPFGTGAPPKAPSRDETIAVLKRAFRDTGMRTPERYYQMGFKDLRTLAKAGDIYANLQLGMQYAFTRAALESDQDYDFSLNPKAEAFRLFSNASLMGSTSAMVMISTKLADTAPVEAYAWKIISDRLTSESQLDFYHDNIYEFRLSSEDVKKANALSEEVMREMLSRPRIPPPPE